jgi:putative serine protease PepD
MKRLAAAVGTVVVAGLSIAALVIALDNGHTTPASSGATAVSQPPTAGVGSAGSTSSRNAETIYSQDAPGVVVITATQTEATPGTFLTPPSEQQVDVLGSGFVIDQNGDIVTNDHVVEDASDVTVGFLDGSTYPAKVLGSDPSTDVAVIHVDSPTSELHPLDFADSSGVQVGDEVYAIGNPFGLDSTMTAGIVSAIGRDIQAPNGLGIPNAIQTDAAINHGNSGGPLLDTSGHVIGVDDQIDSGGTVDGNVGVGFAISSSTAKSIAGQLIASGHVSHAFLGVEVAPITPEIARAMMNNTSAHGLLVVRVVPGSPAAAAGLQPATVASDTDGKMTIAGGDTIVSVDGKPIDSSDELGSIVQNHKPGDRLRLQLERDGDEQTVTVTLGNAPDN